MPADPQQLTPWFDGSVKPVRRGFYERKILGPNSFDYWNGTEWRINDRLLPSLFQPHLDRGADFQWRGLTKEQK